MLLTCENCQTVFRIDDAQLSHTARQVRCSICQHVWFVRPSAGRSYFQAYAVLVHVMYRGRFWVLGLSMFLALAVLVTGYRGAITAHAPGLIPFFHIIGLRIKPDLHALEIEQFQASYQGDLLRVHGRIVNKGGLLTHAPLVRVRVRDDEGALLHTQIFAPENRFIKADEASVFFIQTEIPPPDDAHLDAHIEIGMLEDIF